MRWRDEKQQVTSQGRFSSIISYVYLTVLAIIMTFPLVWIIISSIKSKGELAGDPTVFFPKQISFKNFRIVFQDMEFGRNVINSILVAGTTTLVAVTISALGAYGIVRFFRDLEKVDKSFDYHLYVSSDSVGSSIFNLNGQVWLG